MIVQTIIEISQGSSNKYEYDIKSGRLRLDRVLFSAAHYPTNYGFICDTWGEDNDPLDILAVGSTPIAPGVQVDVRVVGVLIMEDEHGPDAKIIGVVEKDPRFQQVLTLHDIGEHRLREIQHFFKEYKTLQGLATIVGDFEEEARAIQLVEDSRQRFLARKSGEGAT